MSTTINAGFRERLHRRERLLGSLLSLPSPEIAELLAGAGFDWLFIDMEHGLLDVESVQRAVQAVGSRCACVVRVPNHEPIWIAKALDTGAAGVILPHVNTADEARAAVKAAKYPPLGERSIGAVRAQAYGRGLDDGIARGNEETVVIAQVEHAAAVPHIGEIVAVPGIDGVFIGPFDLSASLGRPGQIEAPDVQQAIRTFADACAAVPLACGIFTVSAAGARQAFASGHSLVCAMTDTLLLAEASTELVKGIRGS